MERVGSCAWPSLSGGVFCCEENCVRSAVCLDVHRDASARKLVAEMLCHSVFLLLSIQTAVGLTHERASSHCSEQYARTSLVVCEMCYVDSDCTRAKTPFLIVWTTVSPLFLVVAPLVTVGPGSLCCHSSRLLWLHVTQRNRVWSGSHRDRLQCSDQFVRGHSLGIVVCEKLISV